MDANALPNRGSWKAIANAVRRLFYLAFSVVFSGLIMYSYVRSHDTVAGVTSAWRPSKFVQEKLQFQ